MYCRKCGRKEKLVQESGDYWSGDYNKDTGAKVYRHYDSVYECPSRICRNGDLLFWQIFGAICSIGIILYVISMFLTGE